MSDQQTSQLTPSAIAELTPDEAFTRARDAIATLRTVQNRVGQPGNFARLTTGLRSTQLLDVPDVAAWHAEQVAAIEADLGGRDALSTLTRAHVRELARLEVILGSMGDDLLAKGVLTGKGKMRAAALLYLQVLDRFGRLSASVGLKRVPRTVSLAERLAASEVP